MQTSWILGTGKSDTSSLGRAWEGVGSVLCFWRPFSSSRQEMPHQDKKCSCRIMKGERVMGGKRCGGTLLDPHVLCDLRLDFAPTGPLQREPG